MCGLNALEKSPGKYTIVKGKNPAKKPTGNFVPGHTPRKDFSSAEKAAMLKRAKAHAAEVAQRKGK